MASRSPEPVLRTFVALVPHEATTRALAGEAERIAQADRAARLVPPENVHLTLVFLGATPAAAVPTLVEALELAASATEPVRLRPTGLSAFPSPRAPRVVFAALAPETHPALEGFAARVTEALAVVGWSPDRPERFHPHLTLARLESPSPSPALEKLLTAGALQSTYIDDVITELHFLASEPAPAGGRRGSVYRTLAAVPLRSTPVSSGAPPPRAERP